MLLESILLFPLTSCLQKTHLDTHYECFVGEAAVLTPLPGVPDGRILGSGLQLWDARQRIPLLNVQAEPPQHPPHVWGDRGPWILSGLHCTGHHD